MIYIPITTKSIYVSGLVALNIHSPEGTGDWHSSRALETQKSSTESYIYGDNQLNNTNYLLDDKGIINGTNRLNAMGYYPKNTPVWIAEHPRACADYLYVAVLKTGLIGRVMLNEWFPSNKDKHSVYELLNIIEEKLTKDEKKNLVLWKKKNPLN